jgi:hypothetical protein
MWQPNAVQWRAIWILAAFIVLAWPPAEGKSLALKAAAWAVDPFHTLPVMPPELPMGLGDDGYAVAEHDRQLTSYYDAYQGSSMKRFRIDVRDFENPFDPTTERQVLVGIGVFGALLIWRLGGRD